MRQMPRTRRGREEEQNSRKNCSVQRRKDPGCHRDPLWRALDDIWRQTISSSVALGWNQICRLTYLPSCHHDHSLPCPHWNIPLQPQPPLTHPPKSICLDLLWTWKLQEMKCICLYPILYNFLNICFIETLFTQALSSSGMSCPSKDKSENNTNYLLDIVL